MEKNKNKKREITIKSLNKGFGIALFVLVFVFTFAFIDPTVKQHPGIWGIALGSSLAALGIAWGVTILVFKKKQDAKDVNKQKINQALEKLEDQAKKEKEKQLIDESNS